MNSTPSDDIILYFSTSESYRTIEHMIEKVGCDVNNIFVMYSTGQ